MCLFEYSEPLMILNRNDETFNSNFAPRRHEINQPTIGLKNVSKCQILGLEAHPAHGSVSEILGKTQCEFGNT